jgi:hypothetical protein
MRQPRAAAWWASWLRTSAANYSPPTSRAYSSPKSR